MFLKRGTYLLPVRQIFPEQNTLNTQAHSTGKYILKSSRALPLEVYEYPKPGIFICFDGIIFVKILRKECIDQEVWCNVSLRRTS